MLIGIMKASPLVNRASWPNDRGVFFCWSEQLHAHYPHATHCALVSWPSIMQALLGHDQDALIHHFG